VTSDDILNALRADFPETPFEIGPATDQPTLYLPRMELEPVCLALRDGPDLQFLLLAELTAADCFPRDPRFEVVYHLASLGVPVGGATTVATQKRLRLKVRVSGDDPHVPSVSSVWPCANWLEREVFDLFGVIFDGHPDLRRILMPDDWDGYPLRKDYPVQVGVSVRTSEPLQLTAEEFAANMMRAGRASGAAAPRPATSDGD
jgi:NADH-quinone oxidoreductase subunit C